MANGNGVSKWKWVIGPFITLFLVGVGFFASWTTMKVSIFEIQKDLINIEQKTESIQDKVHDLEIKGAVDASVLKEVQKDVNEIKNDVKKLLEPR